MAVDDPTQAVLPVVQLLELGDLAVERDLLSQFRGLPRWEAMVRGLAEGAQLAEDTFFDLLDGMLLQSATGDALDKWGTLVGEQRQGLGDDDYRRFIGARILVNACGGTPDELIAIAQIITAPSTVRLIPLPPAYYKLEVLREDPLTDAMVSRVMRMLEDARPGGVGMGVVEAVGGYFGFDGDGEALGYDAGTFARLLS